MFCRQIVAIFVSHTNIWLDILISCLSRTNNLTLPYTGGEGGRIPPLLTLVLNSVSGIQAIVLMFGDFS